MNLKNVENKEKSTVALTVEVTAEEFNAAIEQVYRKMKGQMSVPGFRKGKAPRKLIEKLYGANVFFEDAINELYPNALDEAVKEAGIEVVGYPSLDLQNVSAEEGFTFVATLGVKPVAKLGQYKGIAAGKQPVEVTDEDVDAEMKPFIDRATNQVEVDRPVESGDTANIDFEGFKDGVAFEGGKGENYDLKIGSGSFIPGFEDQVIGMTVGEEKELNVTFPEEYGASELAGAPVVFKVKVNTIKTEIAPVIDDEFAKDVSEFDTLEELKADLRTKVTERKEKSAQEAFEQAVMDIAVANAEMEVPDTMVEYEADKMMQNYESRMAGSGIGFDQYLQMMGTNRAEFLNNCKDGALRNIKTDLLLEAVVAAEGIEASEEEIDAEVAKLAEEYKMETDKIKAAMSADQLAYGVKMDKASKLIRESAVVENA